MRALLLFTLLAGSLATAAVLGGYDYILANDRSGITLGVIMLVGLCTAFGQWRRNLLRWVIAEQVCPLMGLLGTVLGFMAALEGITGDVTAAKLAGVHTALITTAAGMLAHLWLLVVRESTR